MENDKVSFSSLITTYCRGYHSANDDPKIFDDFLAYRFLTEEERVTFDRQTVAAFQLWYPERATSLTDPADALRWMVKDFMPSSLFVSRARYTEDSLETAVKEGVRQYVILGAGMDTFAFRRPELVEKLKVFEVDHPATQAFKRRRIDELGWEYPVQLHFVPANFMHECLAEVLKSPYDPNTLAFFSWLGVVHYLPRDAVFTTLRTIAGICPAGSMLVFDYYDTDAFIPGRAAQRVTKGMEISRKTGEPMVTGFDPSTLAVDLHSVGLHLKEDLGPPDIQERYFKGRTDGYYPYEHAHFACAVVE